MSVIRHHRLLPLGSLILILSGCSGPKFSELDISPEVVDHLPREDALQFVTSLYQGTGVNDCMFYEDGVRSVLFRGPPQPYNRLWLEPGPLGLGMLHGPAEWSCLFGGTIQAQYMRMDEQRFMRKAATALLALGVRKLPSAE